MVIDQLVHPSAAIDVDESESDISTVKKKVEKRIGVRKLEYITLPT
jgi:hypothetical protein